MYIKQVIIQGFRSYRDQTVIEPFSPKSNVIVGRNGSGKSNFFYAIQFVLSDEFTHMREEERQALLHEGTGPQVISAFVEIIFDNSDNRLPIDKDEVSLRRVIGSKKDQYFLDRKNVTKTDVMNLLESAGFSKSNPYYIVKQGKINQLATAKDHERLKLLREVAGTRVYDERKEESKHILSETENKREKIEELLRYIEERLETLQEETKELQEYEKLDKDRRCIEYTIYERELRSTSDTLVEFEQKHDDSSHRACKLQNELTEAVDKVEEITDNIRKLKERSVSLQEEKQQSDEERRELIKNKTKLELDIRDSEDAVREFHSSKGAHETELESVKAKIAQRETRLHAILPQYKRLKTAEEDCTRRMRWCEQRREELFSKKGRTNQFTSKEARDEWITNELRSLATAVSTKESQILGLRDGVRKYERNKDKMTGEIKERIENLEQRKVAIEEAKKNHFTLRKNRDDLANMRKELWRKEAELEQNLQNLTEDRNKWERTLRGSVSKAIYNGIESVKTIVREETISGYYGPLIENFTCEEAYYTAVEVTAGNRLFHLLVDTDKTATDILRKMNQRKMPGSVSFLPLNKLTAKKTQYPKNPDATGLITILKYDEEKFKKAMVTVFGKTLLCRYMDTASNLAKSANMDCVTVEGDQFSRRGAMTGGYYDTRKSRLACQHSIVTVKKKIAARRQEHEVLRQELERIDGQITSILGELQRVETTQIDLKETYERQKVEVKSKQKEMQSMEQSLAHKVQLLSKMDADLQAMRASHQSLSSELGTEMMAHLSNEDQQEVERLNEETQQLQENLRSVLSERTTLEAEKNQLENVITNNLQKRKDKLVQELDEMAFEGKEQHLESVKVELVSLDERLRNIMDRIKNLDTKRDDISAQVKTLEEGLEEWKSLEKERRNQLEEDGKSVEKMANKRSALIKKKDECTKKIRELGSLPTDAFDKYKKTAVKTLWTKLQRCKEDLKKFGHVNKKALDQFNNFSEQKDKFVKRKEEMDKGHEAILELMDALEHRKHEAIMFTFKQVSHNFAAVFKELVPRGKANLVMKTQVPPPTDDESSQASTSERQSQMDVDDSSQPSTSGSQARMDDEEESSQSQSKLPSDKFSGVSIKVSFTGKTAETREMDQLSGGQKSLVALALIFAIQRCDPAPFYLFDEIDQALDPQYRTSVAEMIKTQAETAQFITTTFRAELLEASDKFYGVRFRNKVSHIDAITKDEAKEFLTDDDTTPAS